MVTTEFTIDSERSTVLVQARSSMGPIVFEAREIRGTIEASVVDGAIDDGDVRAHLEVAMQSLRSGNDLYDGELRRRIDSRRHPTCRLELTRARAGTGRIDVEGEMTFHGQTRTITGGVEVEAASADQLLVTGTKELDIRDFGIPAPGILMVKIYPDVQVQIFVVARAMAAEE